MKKIITVLLLLIIIAPGVVMAQQYKEERVYYTVKKGDYLRAIADMYGTTVAELHKLNPFIKDINKIYPGQRVLFIDRKGVEARKRAAANNNNEQLAAQRAQAEREARMAAEQRQRQEQQLAEQRRQQEAQLAAERKRLEDERLAHEKQLAEDRRKMEEERRKQLEEERRKAAQQQKVVKEEPANRLPMYVAVRGFGSLSTNIDTMEIAPYGYGGAFDYNAQITKWFGITFSLDAGYLAGNNKGVDAKSVNMGARAFFVFQPNIALNSSGVQPYIGIGPSYTYSLQDVYVSATSNCNIGKHRAGVAATAGLNYSYKDFIFGIDVEYNYVIPISSDNQLIHLDMASGLTAGLRFGYRF